MQVINKAFLAVAIYGRVKFFDILTPILTYPSPTGKKNVDY